MNAELSIFIYQYTVHTILHVGNAHSCKAGIELYVMLRNAADAQMTQIVGYMYSTILCPAHIAQWHHPCEYSFGTVESHMPYMPSECIKRFETNLATL